MKAPIIGFVFDVKGLMAGISLKGAKFTRSTLNNQATALRVAAF